MPSPAFLALAFSLVAPATGAIESNSSHNSVVHPSIRVSGLNCSGRFPQHDWWADYDLVYDFMGYTMNGRPYYKGFDATTGSTKWIYYDDQCGFCDSGCRLNIWMIADVEPSLSVTYNLQYGSGGGLHYTFTDNPSHRHCDVPAGLSYNDSMTLPLGNVIAQSACHSMGGDVLITIEEVLPPATTTMPPLEATSVPSPTPSPSPPHTNSTSSSPTITATSMSPASTTTVSTFPPWSWDGVCEGCISTDTYLSADCSGSPALAFDWERFSWQPKARCLWDLQQGIGALQILEECGQGSVTYEQLICSDAECTQNCAPHEKVTLDYDSGAGCGRLDILSDEDITVYTKANTSGSASLHYPAFQACQTTTTTSTTTSTDTSTTLAPLPPWSFDGACEGGCISLAIYQNADCSGSPRWTSDWERFSWQPKARCFWDSRQGMGVLQILEECGQGSVTYEQLICSDAECTQNCAPHEKATVDYDSGAGCGRIDILSDEDITLYTLYYKANTSGSAPLHYPAFQACQTTTTNTTARAKTTSTLRTTTGSVGRMTTTTAERTSTLRTTTRSVGRMTTTAAEREASSSMQGGGVPCGPEPAASCTSDVHELCVYDETCDHDPPRRGGLGCNAGGKSQSCRFCGFGHFLSCDLVKSLKTEGIPCTSTAAPVCAGLSEPCYYDPQCTTLPTAIQGLGCNAGGAGLNCRFCGFGEYYACPRSPLSI